MGSTLKSLNNVAKDNFEDIHTSFACLPTGLQQGSGLVGTWGACV